MLRRRREVFFGLIVAVAASGLLGCLPGLSMLWGACVLSAGALVVYVVTLLRLHAAEVERREKIRYLPTLAERSRRQVEPVLLLHRSAN